MKPADFYQSIVVPTSTGILKALAPQIKDSSESRVLLLTIAGIESDWTGRRQNGGPARGYWQFEMMGGVKQLTDGSATTRGVMIKTCAALDIPFTLDTIFEAMAWNDTLACVMARLLLWQDPAPLPAVGAEVAAWDYYLRNWRPGAPRAQAWHSYYETSRKVMG